MHHCNEILIKFYEKVYFSEAKIYLGLYNKIIQIFRLIKKIIVNVGCALCYVCMGNNVLFDGFASLFEFPYNFMNLNFPSACENPEKHVS
jgi:hypothetical protein